MLIETYRLAAAVPLGSSRTAFVEAFCIQARVLHEFLTDRPRTGVHASAVTNGYVPFANGPIDPAIIRKLSDHVAHLSLERSTDPGRASIEIQNSGRSAGWRYFN